jgi:hypothetical protein
MITKLKKLTGDNKELDKDQCRKIKGFGVICGKKCDEHCGAKPGNDAENYSGQMEILEEPVF